MVSGSVVQLASAPAGDEASLIAEAAAGDPAAQDALVRRYLRDVYEVALRVLREPDLAQDAAQDALVNALRGLRRFRGEASFRTWLLRIALNTARSAGRRAGRRREVPLELVDTRADERAAVADVVVRQDEARRIGQLLDRLPPKQRMAVTLRVNQGLSFAEIAGVMRCTEGAARVNYHLGIRRLREWLQ
jgi:RNA polymerase sigma-70 factor (ECF subfamily)